MRNTGPITVTKLHPLFGAEVSGIDITRPLSPREFGPIRAAFEEHSVLLFRDQPMDDEKQIQFSDNFGPLETTGSSNPAAGTKFQRQSNLDIMTGEPIPPRRHAHDLPEGQLLLALRLLVQARAVAVLDPDRARLPTRGRQHRVPGHARGLGSAAAGAASHHPAADRRARPALFAQPGAEGNLSAKAIAELPPVKQRLYRDNPINGRRALYIGAHAGHIVGWPKATGEALLYELSQRADQPEFRLSHAWREGDVIVWDNRAVLHRATYYDAVKHKRFMQRTTIGGDLPTVPQ